MRRYKKSKKRVMKLKKVGGSFKSRPSKSKRSTVNRSNPHQRGNQPSFKRSKKQRSSISPEERSRRIRQEYIMRSVYGANNKRAKIMSAVKNSMMYEIKTNKNKYKVEEQKQVLKYIKENILEFKNNKFVTRTGEELTYRDLIVRVLLPSNKLMNELPPAPPSRPSLKQKKTLKRKREPNNNNNRGSTRESETTA